MGWWDTGVLGGDPPLDVILRIEKLTGCGDLYPLSHIDNPRGVATALTDYGLDRLSADTADSDYPQLSTQVVGVIAMAVGADLGEFAERIRAAARADEWAATDAERRADMDTLTATVDGYDGTPTNVDSPGLFDGHNDVLALFDELADDESDFDS